MGRRWAMQVCFVGFLVASISVTDNGLKRSSVLALPSAPTLSTAFSNLSMLPISCLLVFFTGFSEYAGWDETWDFNHRNGVRWWL